MWSKYVEVEVAWGARGHAASGDAVWDDGLWDNAPTDLWSGIDPTWAVLDDCLIGSLDIQRGRSKATERYSAGTATITLLAKGTGQAGLWSWLRAQPTIGDELRIRARLLGGGEWWPLFRGTIRALTDTFEISGRLAVTVNLTDALADIAAVDLPELDPPVGAGERTDQRITRVLQAAMFPLERARLDVGVVACQATNLARNLLDEAQVTAESEIGDLWCDAAGVIVFRNRQWWRTDPRATAPQVSFGNTGDPDHCPATFTTALDLADLENQVSMARAGGTAITVSDATSIARYGLHTHTRFDLVCADDDDVYTAAAFRLAENRQRTRRIDTLTVNPEAAIQAGHPVADAWAAVLEVQLGDGCQVDWLAGGATEPESLFMHVQGWTHTVTASGEWVTEYQVWDRIAYTPAAGWDIAVWGTDVWAAA